MRSAVGVALETTLLGASMDEDEELEVVKILQDVRETLDEETADTDAWKTFSKAVATGTEDLVENDAKFEAEDEPQYQITDIDEARNDRIMPISYQKAE